LADRLGAYVGRLAGRPSSTLPMSTQAHLVRTALGAVTAGKARHRCYDSSKYDGAVRKICPNMAKRWSFLLEKMKLIPGKHLLSLFYTAVYPRHN
jgi:hypothetical protein